MIKIDKRLNIIELNNSSHHYNINCCNNCRKISFFMGKTCPRIMILLLLVEGGYSLSISKGKVALPLCTDRPEIDKYIEILKNA